MGPEKGDEIVFLYCADNDGGDLSGDNWKPLENRAPEWLRELSTRSRFFVFAHDFLAWRRGNGQAEFKFQTVDRTHQPGFLLCLRSAAEFLSKKDYTDNWRSELKEEFCFWGFTRWKQALSETGFHVLEDPN